MSNFHDTGIAYSKQTQLYKFIDMKKLFLLFAIVWLSVSGYAQTIVYHENFELSSLGDSVVSSGSPAWAISTKLAKSGLRSDTAVVGNNSTSYLTTAAFNTTGYGNVILQFSHICKVDFFDTATVEVSHDNGATWTQLTASQYLGTGFYSYNKFGANSYADWLIGTPSATPTNTWWKTEQFDISAIAGNFSQVKVRFKLEDGGTPGGGGNYGWLIDDILVNGATSELVPPSITLNAPLLQDTVYSTGPFAVSATITDVSGVQWAKIAYKLDGATNYDTIVMTNASGNIWNGNIPSFTYNNKIWYHVVAIDNSTAHNIGLNPSSGDKWFLIMQGPADVIVGTGTVTTNNYYPLYNFYENNRTQMLYKASEINSSGSITHLALDISFVTADITKRNLLNFTIKIKPTSISTLGTAYEDMTAATIVFTNASYNLISSLGWHDFDITDFPYNGTSNLIVEITWGDNGAYCASGDQYNVYRTDYSTGADVLVVYGYADAETPPLYDGNSKIRPNIKFSFPVTNYGEDAGITQVNEPTGIVLAGTSLPVKVTVKNFGVDTLVKATINWKLDGVLQSPYNWTGSLLQAVSSNPVTLTSQSFTAGSHTIKAWTELPNDSIDENHMNDTTTASFYACSSILNGTYTIGPSAADFPTFAAALSAMQNCGISGPVVFNVQSGTYTEQLSFPEIGGASATNTITFQSLTGVNTDVTLQFATTTANNYVLQLNAADHFRFKNMTLKNTGTAYAHVLEMNGIAIDNQFDGNKFIGKDTTNTSTNFALVYSASGTTSVDSLSVFNNNTFTHGSYGMYFYGGSSSILENKTSITNNTFTNQYYAGIYLYYQNAPTISGNTITTNTTNTAFYGIYTAYCDNNLRILKNKITITNSGYGIYIYYCDGVSGAEGLTANNAVSIGGTTTTYGIYDYYSTFQNIYFNSVNVYTNYTTANAMYLSGGSTYLNHNFKNNIFAYTGSNTSGRAFYVGTPAMVSSSDYNDLYSTGTSLGYWSVAQANLATWQAASLQDANSISSNPNFISATNLHTFDSGLNGLATPIAGITDDIDGEIRNTTTPDIGADEFTPLSTDIGIISVIAPVDGCGLGTTENVTLQLKNLGGTTITTADVYYKLNNGTPVHEVFNTSIAPNATYNYTFTQQVDLSAIANYTFKFYVALTGDLNLLNDTISNYTISNGWDFYSSAYTMGFEPTDNMSAWSKLDVNADARTWEFPYNSATYAHTGSNSARFYNGTTNPGNDWLFSRCFSLNAGETYKIDYWYRVESATYPESVDLKVGNSATPAAMTTTLVSMPSFTNTTYQKATALFTPTTSGTYYFGWYAYSPAANYYAFIDDINIALLPNQEASIVSMITPVSGCGLGNENVKIRIANTGGALINGNLSAHYKIIGGSSTITEAVTQQIAIGGMYDFTFATQANLTVTTQDSTFKIATWIDLISDPFVSNDSITTDVHSFHIPADPIVVSDTVPYGGIATLHASSADSLYWYAAATGGTPIGTGSTFTTPNLYITTPYYVEAKSGAPSIKFTEIATYRTGTGQTPTYPTWATGADLLEITNLGSAPQNLQGYSCEILGIGARTFALPNVDLPASQVMVLCAGTGTDSPANFYYNMGGSNDAISSGSASGFVIKDALGVIVDAVALNSYTFLPASGVTSIDWSGNSASTSGLAGEIRTVSDNNTASDWIVSSTTNTQTIGTLNPMLTAGSGGGGCASNRVPDTAYVQLLPIEAGIFEFSSPVSGCTNGTENIIINIRNNGSSTINPGFSASYIVNGTTPVTETVNTQILAGDTLTFTFATPLTAGVTTANRDSVYNVKAYIALTGDSYNINDTINKSFTLNYTPPAPVVNNVSIPYGTAATLTALSADSIFWYNSPTSQNSVAIGPVYTTPVLYGNAVYYAEASIPGVNASIGTGTTSEYYVPFYGDYDFGWSAMLYKANEINSVGRIDTISFYVNNAVTAYPMLSQNIYMSETSDAIFATADKPDPATMTQVFTGDLTWNGPGWYKIALQNPFTYSGNSNLMIYWENMDGDYISSGYPYFNSTPTTGNLAKYKYQDNTFPTTAGTLTVNRPNIKFISAPGCSSIRVSDTVFVTGVPANDASVEIIHTPNSGIELSNAETVKVRIKNYGTTAISGFPVSYKIDNNAPVTETVSSTINSNDTLLYTFTTAADLSVFATYNFKAYTSLTGDLTHVNDTAYKTVINNPLTYCTSSASSPTSYEDIGNVTFSNINNGIATPVTSNTTAVNGYTDFTSTVAPAQLSAGVTYPVSVSIISASSFYSTYVKVFIDYNRDGVFTEPAETAFGAQSTSTLTTVTGNIAVPLTAVTGQLLMMRVVAVETSTASAVVPCGTYSWGETEDYFVNIAPLIPHDAGVISILQPVAVENEAASVPVQVIVKNFGTDTIRNSSNMMVDYSLNGGTAVSTLWNLGNLAPMASDTITLPNITIPAGQNNICAYTVLAGDSNTVNDQTCKSFYGTPLQDAGVIKILQPGSIAASGSSAAVQVVFKNYGVNTITSMSLAYEINGGAPVSQAWSGNLVSNATDTLLLPNFTVPAATYNICSYTILAGDGDHTNDTLCKNSFGIFKDTLPYYDNFEGPVIAWYDSTLTPGTIWEHGTPAYGVTNSAHSPTKAWDVNLTTAYTNSATAYLYTQLFDFTNAVNAKLKFWQNRNVEVSYDGIRLEYSTDGSTWGVLGIMNDPKGVNWYNDDIISSSTKPGWTGNSNGWIKSEYILDTLNGEPNVQFRFVFNSDGSGILDGMSIDDISITIPSPIDAGVEAITRPIAQTADGATVQVKVRIRNFGNDTLHNIPVAYSVNGGLPVTGTWPGYLNPNDTVSYLFPTTFTSPAGQYTICATTSLTGDGDHLNDTTCKSIVGIPTFNLPYADNFEGTNYWLSSDGSAQWELGVPASSIINTAHSPVNAWKTNLDGNYVANMNDNLYTPVFNLDPAMDTVTLSFWHWYESQTVTDGGRIQYTLNGGTTWITMGYMGDLMATNWYTTGGGNPAWSGSSAGWVKSTYKLAKALFNNFASPIQFRFNFFSDGSTQLNGWAIDDFSLTVPPIPIDAGVISIDQPAISTPMYSAVNVDVQIKNFGTDTLLSIPVAYKVNSGTPVTVTWTGTLLPGDTATYSFATTYVSPAAAYTLCAYTDLAADTHAFNDSICMVYSVTAALVDAGFTKIILPSGLMTNIGPALTVKATLKNFGASTLTSIPVAIIVNGGTPIPETWTGTLLPGDSTDYTFTATYVAPYLGFYTLCATTALTTDPVPANDKACKAYNTNLGIEEAANNGMYLGQNIPNPANNMTRIDYYVPNNGNAKFSILNGVGQLIYTESKDVMTGDNSITLDISKYTAGIYYYTLEFNGGRLYRKMIIVK